MTMTEMKRFLEGLVQRCLGGNVCWAEQYSPQMPLPLATLKLKDTGIPVHSADRIVGGEIYSYYACEKILEVNRYTAGTATGQGVTTGLENTAVDGLLALALYLQSPKGVEEVALKNICILQMGPARDLTAPEGTRYKNRAMQEFTVSYTLECHDGEAVVYVPEVPGYPGAGQGVGEGPVGYFESVEMEERYE